MSRTRGHAIAEMLVYEGSSALSRSDDVAAMYREIYAEEPYCEGLDDFQAFEEGWPRRVEQPGFRLVVAQQGDLAAGFAFGHQLPPDTRWWAGTLDPVTVDLTTEYPGRTFAIIELAVRGGQRRKGIGRS